jgi:hypothetical protein
LFALLSAMKIFKKIFKSSKSELELGWENFVMGKYFK